MVRGLRDRFSSSRHVLEAYTVFSPRFFSSFYKTYPTTVHVERKVAKFCKTYGIDSILCAKELFSFAGAFERLISLEKPYDFNDKATVVIVITVIMIMKLKKMKKIVINPSWIFPKATNQ